MSPLTLPKQKTPPKRTLSDVSILIYGPSKIGKSTFASQSPDAIFLATEPGLNALEVYQQPIRSWSEFLEACNELAKGNHPFKTVVIDTIDILYRLCADHVCQKHGVEHESMGSHGKIYGLIKNEMYRVLTKIGHLPYGLILISHSQDRDLETRTGTVTRTVPTLTESFRQIIIGLVDLILLCDIDVTTGPDGKRAQRRVIRTKPSANYDAGDRFGILPDTIDLDYTAFVRAFEGKSDRQNQKGPGAQCTASTSTPTTPNLKESK